MPMERKRILSGALEVSDGPGVTRWRRLAGWH
jgi:hypothetical protein